MHASDVINFTLQNWEVIVGLVFFAVHMGLKWGVIRGEKLTALYNEAIAYGDQMKKQAGLTTGVELTGAQVFDLVLDYLHARVPALHAIDADKIEALLNVKNTQRDAGMVALTSPIAADASSLVSAGIGIATGQTTAKQALKEVEIGAVQNLLANAQRHGWSKLKFPMCLWVDQK
ncbi:MAG TPA: hypothetical protein VGL77_20325 [Armatimonadota bacterium]|jgi:hypothetical protein